jgi:hypothetical protein
MKLKKYSILQYNLQTLVTLNPKLSMLLKSITINSTSRDEDW